uniref:Uncharacterized protein n=1 Tax=Oryza brachyantha TaxID=4533 RepID=J3N7Q2_ORYBR
MDPIMIDACCHHGRTAQTFAFFSLTCHLSRPLINCSSVFGWCLCAFSTTSSSRWVGVVKRDGHGRRPAT